MIRECVVIPVRNRFLVCFCAYGEAQFFYSTMSKADTFIREHFPGALPTEASRLSGDIFNEEFFPDMTEEQFHNIPEDIRDVIVTSYPLLKKFEKHENPQEVSLETQIEHAIEKLQINKHLARVEELLERTLLLLLADREKREAAAGRTVFDI
jgi:hypothetical protein